MALTDKDCKKIELIVDAAIVKGIQKCPAGHDRENRLRNIEHVMNGHIAVASEVKDTKTAFWMPLAYSVIGGLIVGLVVKFA